MDLEYIIRKNSSKIGADFMHTIPHISYPYLTIISTVSVTGSLGNILVIAAVLTNKQLRHVGNIFIVNLSIADLCVTAFVNPFSIIGILEGEVYFEDKPGLCEAVASICLTSCFTSLLSIGAISFNRFIHIVHNKMYQKIYTLRNCVIMCIGLWTVSFLMELPNFLGWGDHVYDRKTLSCVWDRTADFTYTLFFDTVGVVFPVVLISICYLKIYLHVLASKRRVAAVNKSTSGSAGAGEGSNAGMLTAKQAAEVSRAEKARRESMKLARTLFVIFVAFAACWTPYAIIVLADVDDTFPRELHIFSILLAHTNSSLNSILYGLTNQHFRDAYFRLLGLRRCLKGRRDAMDTSMSMTAAPTTKRSSTVSVINLTAAEELPAGAGPEPVIEIG